MLIRSKALFVAIAASPLFVLASLPGLSADFKTTAKPIKGQYIVVLKEGVARLAGESRRTPTASAVAEAMAARHRFEVTRRFDHVLRGFAVRANDAALARLLADPRVAYVEEDSLAQLHATQTGAPWGLDRIDQRDRPVNGTYVYNSTAPSVHAYVIDSGILGTHTQFTGRMGNGFTSVADGRGTTDCNGHGTHVAGTLGGTTYGVAKGVKLHPVRVFPCVGGAPWSQIIAGMDWVRANHVKPAVANMSLGGFANASADTAVTNLVAAGVIVVVSAGNDNANACNASPARVASVLTVGSMRSDDGRSYFSNYGSCLDLFAPGSSILSAWSTGTTATNTISGTSMASPHVAGMAALHLAANPLATPAQVASAINTTATPGRVLAAGAGSPNRLLFTLGGTIPPPPATSLPTITDFECPFTGGYGQFACRVTYLSDTPAAVLWPGPSQTRNYNGMCGTGMVTVSVVVGNRSGSVSQTASFPCPTNPPE